MTTQQTKAKLNAAVKTLARVDRPLAEAILAKHGVFTTADLRPELWQVVLEEIEEARSKIVGKP